ncbi:lysine ketoglutarate reductase trans-splicing-like protein [Actinidia rufa]|uniref:Lysine ketoglutarate reductase trans-splicing-like protein n=1 Tax=Actinidia rufa TaxID=165716 RepID=A0A7J0F0U4_9ERIC|nr:lysine ketoglutarate reductase trans-splicing-like protein [Actinidia rufa]
MLFHYDGNVDGWWDLSWSKKAIHIVAQNQTKWWFAKRFLHPAVVSRYDYIFLWDEDLGVENFHPGRYLKIVKSEELEISQPALDPNSTGESGMLEVVQSVQRTARGHHAQGKFVEGMAPVFSRSAWHCAWHLIQNDLVHGWGMDMKLGYCALGDRTANVGIVDSEYVVHQGLPTLGGKSARKIRRQSTSELQIFKERWEQAVKNDRNWVDPFQKKRRLTRQRNLRLHI